MFDPKGFMDIAHRMAHKNGAAEAELRTAVGRAYYGVFLQAREILAATGEISPTWAPQDHQLVVDALKDRGGPSGNQLHKLRAGRNRDDYELGWRRTQQSATQIVALAEAVWNGL